MKNISDKVTIDATEIKFGKAFPPINLWKDWSNREKGISGRVFHRNKVKLIDRNGDYVLLETKDGAQGWCNYHFIKELKVK